MNCILTTEGIYLERKVGTDVGQDGDGREGDQHGPDQVTGHPARDQQGQGASGPLQLFQVEGHSAKTVDVQIEDLIKVIEKKKFKL